jgi:hypothetical protein
MHGHMCVCGYTSIKLDAMLDSINLHRGQYFFWVFTIVHRVGVFVAPSEEKIVMVDRGQSFSPLTVSKFDAISREARLKNS